MESGYQQNINGWDMNEQFETAMWLLSDGANEFVKNRINDSVGVLISEILRDHRNTFSFCEALLAATEIYFEREEITNWSYNSIGDWLDDVAELWLGNPDFYNAKVLIRSRQHYTTCVSFLIGEKYERLAGVPTSLAQFNANIIPKKIRFIRIEK